QGTLFLDEIGEMPATAQSKILRAVEEGTIRRLGSKNETAVDARLLAATNRDPREAIQDGKLREDLYYRLSVFTIEMPALRKRASDIPLLAQHFVRSCNDRHKACVEGIGAEVLEILTGYRWPGNVRELRNVVERAVIVAGRGWIETTHLPPFLHKPNASNDSEIVLPAGSTAAEAEKILILETLKKTGDNKTRAAKLLGLDVRTIRYKLRAWADQE
ncbi:MAG: sigma 54-interacting transcriptional regulator, partial [Acidobacteriota bacterium]|nr:sigma 54-interacting transcriptional regulator [Acidobacteriota bacterium]